MELLKRLYPLPFTDFTEQFSVHINGCLNGHKLHLHTSVLQIAPFKRY